MRAGGEELGEADMTGHARDLTEPLWKLTPGSKLDKMGVKEAATYLARQAERGWPGSSGIHPNGRGRKRKMQNEQGKWVTVLE